MSTESIRTYTAIAISSEARLTTAIHRTRAAGTNILYRKKNLPGCNCDFTAVKLKTQRHFRFSRALKFKSV